VICKVNKKKNLHSSSSYSKEALILPTQELSPKTQHINNPSPSRTLVPESNAGEGISCLSYSVNYFPSDYNSCLLLMHFSILIFLIEFVSPVIELSSVRTSEDSIIIPSAGIS